jgi:hypothetical protein
MKWKVNARGLNKGDRRTVRKFAWFPVLVYDGDDTYRAWLETYDQEQVYGWSEDGLRWEPVKNNALFWTV